RHIVACLSPSNSVQSSATTISLRSPTTKRTHESNRRHSCTPVLLRSRSTCLVPCLASLPRTADSPRPIAWIDRLTACTTPRTPSAIESTHRWWTVSANSSSAKRSTLLGATRTFPRRRSVFESVEVTVGVIITVRRTNRPWIQAEGVTPRETPQERGDPSASPEKRGEPPRRQGLDVGSREPRATIPNLGVLAALPSPSFVGAVMAAISRRGRWGCRRASRSLVRTACGGLGWLVRGGGRGG